MSILWSCPKCKRRFRQANQRHACGANIDSDVLRGHSESLAALYSSLESFAKSLGPIEFVKRERYVLMRSTRIFTDLTVMKDALRVVVHLDHRAKEPLFIKTVFDRKRYSHVALIKNKSDLAILKPYVKEAYDLSL